MTGLSFPLCAAFIALPLEDDTKAYFQELQSRLVDFEDILSFQNPASPHLTLQYWKEVMQIEFPAITEQCAKIAGKSSSFSLKIEGIETFGSRGEDRVLFLSVPFSETLARLKKLCPWPSSTPFHPHITLARIRHPQKFHIQKKKIMKLLEGTSFEMEIDRLRLYAEIDGNKQTPLQDFPFSG